MKLTISNIKIIAGVCGVVIAIVIFYFTTTAAIAENADEKINDVNTKISQDRERISKTEEAIATIKANNEEMRRDIKEILRLLK